MLTIYTGPMFSGKTTSLLKMAELLKPEFIWKPSKDTRDVIITSHDGKTMKSKVIEEGINFKDEESNIFIDECQFITLEQANQIVRLSKLNNIFVSMLNMDYLGKEFEVFSFMKNHANIIYLKARCEVCDEPAEYSHRINSSTDLVLCGSKESYEPRCKNHFPLLRVQGNFSESSQAYAP